MPPKKSTGKKKSGTELFVWTDDESELLFKVTQDYKVQQLADGTAWESVKTKYDDILELFRNELPENAQQAVSLAKDYPHSREEITKDILSTKLKAVRIKYRQVC